MQFLTGGQSTAQTFPSMRPVVTLKYLTTHGITHEEHHPILREQVEAAVKAMEIG